MLFVCFLLTVWPSSSAEVVMRETRIDPFTFLFEKQNLLIEKLDSVMERLDSLELTNKHRLSDVIARVDTTDKKMDEIHHMVLSVSDSLDKIVNDLRFSQDTSVQKDEPVTVKCDCDSKTAPTQTELDSKKDSASLLNSLLFSDVYDDNTDYKDSDSNSTSTVDLYTQNLLLQLSKNMMKGFNSTHVVLQELSSAMNGQRDVTNAIWQPLNKLVTKSLGDRMDDFRESLSRQMNIIASNVQQQRVSLMQLSSYFVSTNLTGVNNRQIPSSPDDLDVNSTAFPDDITDQSFVRGTEQFESASVVSENKTENLFQKLTRLLSLNSSNKVHENEIRFQNHTKMDAGCKVVNESMRNDLSDQILKKIGSLENIFNDRISKVEDQITGIKIYQSSSFYSQMKEIRYELNRVADDLSRATESTGSKLGRKVNANKLSLFTFIDAAVTSITSSAVTSSQATGLAIAKTLRNIFHHLHAQMREVSWYGAPDCPGMYQKIGSKCLLILETVESTWTEACHICASLRGRVLPKEEAHELSVLTKLVKPTVTGFWMKSFNTSGTTSGCTLAEEKIEELPEEDSLDTCYSFLNNGTGLAQISCRSKLSVVCEHNHMKCSGKDPMNYKFNVTNAISDLDYFLRNSKYFKF